MIKKTFVFFVLLLSFISIVSFSFTYFNRNVYIIWNTNEIEVSTPNTEDFEKVKIYYGASVNSINRENDTLLFSNMEKYILLFDKGKVKTKLPNEYGENDFLVTYNDQYYFSFRQFKFNRNHEHKYKFKIETENKLPHLYVEIKGEDGMKFDKAMLSISEAINNVCNTPIDSAGFIYNMIDLR